MAHPPLKPSASDAAPGGTSVRIYLPDERLRSFVTFYYFVECSAPLEDFLYPEWGNVRFSVRGDWIVRMPYARTAEPLDTPLFGPTDRAATVITGGGMTAGFGLTPLGWQRLLAIPACDLANRIVDVGDRFGLSGHAMQAALAGHSSDEQGVALFDSLLCDRIAAAPPNSELAIAVDRVLRDRPRDVGTFAAAVGVSAPVLVRVCKRVYGFGPKRLLRRQRFLDTLGQIRITDDPRFTDLLDPEYFDLAHFNHEFHEFMGLSPSEYLSVPRPLMAEAARAQAAVGIPLSFKLPPPPTE